MKPVLGLLHGLAQCRQAWAPQLSAPEADYEVIAPDLPGTGMTPGPFRFGPARRPSAATSRQPHAVGRAAAAASVAPGSAGRGDGRDSSESFQRRRPCCDQAERAADHAGTGPGGPARQSPVGAGAHLGGLRRPGSRFNLRAARRTAQGIPGARLRLVAGAGHAWNETHPHTFREVLNQWVRDPSHHRRRRIGRPARRGGTSAGASGASLSLSLVGRHHDPASATAVQRPP